MLPHKKLSLQNLSILSVRLLPSSSQQTTVKPLLLSAAELAADITVK